uniref:Nuclear transcription factor Y subunit gamma n=1 Tax=Glossina austeni TaxID=7395 RepID=A0A1A9V2J5_GLOAU
MHSNKITTNSSYENSIKMDINVSQSTYERSSSTNCSVPPTNQGGGLTIASVTKGPSHFTLNSPGAGCVGTTAITNATIVHSGPIAKDKPASKNIKQPIPRKPPPTLDNFWPNILHEIQSTQNVDARHQALPLARIKKIMKLDDNAKMIAAEAPLLFAKACEFFIQELTMRAWIHTEESKRRTLQRSDIAQAIANYDQFDFLIDIVPREDIKPSGHHRKHENAQTSTSTSTSANGLNATSSASSSASVTHNSSIPAPASGSVVTGEMINVTTLKSEPLNTIAADQVTTNAALATTNSTQTAQVVTAGQPTQQQVQIIQQTGHHSTPHMQYFITMPGQQPGQPQLVYQLQLQQQQLQPQNLTAAGLNLVTQQPQQLILTAAAPTNNNATLTNHQQQSGLLQNLAQQQQQQVQLVQQVVVTPTGELANVPIAINANQINLLRLQMQQQQHQQQSQQQAPQQIIIPTQLLSAQQLIQLQSQNAAGVHHQHSSQQHHQPQHAGPSSTLYISTSPSVQNTVATSGAERNLNGGYRSNC